MTDSSPRPRPEVARNTWDELREPMIDPAGFREYDVRWRYPDQINLPGLQLLGLGIGTQMHEAGLAPRIVVANDYRSYSLAVKQALSIGLMQAGVEVLDIGPAVTPMAYFAQFHLDAPAVAMVTASHNPNGWTGVKMGFDRPLTHGPEEMARLRRIVLEGQGVERPGGRLTRVDGLREAYLDDLTAGLRLTRPLKVVCACGNGTASAFAPEALRRIGAQVIERHCTLDYDFPNYNPNPEALEMLRDMAAAVRESGADLALGFDGDGDRCGVVDDEGEEIFADKVGVLLAREFARAHPGAVFVADVKSTGLFVSDPELRELGARAEYWKTGHSHMKRRVRELGALAGFEKSGHYFIADPIGRGYDCGLRAAIEICRMLDRRPDASMSDLRRSLPRTWSTPTMSPFCPDEVKYDVVARVRARLEALAASGGALGGRRIADIVSVNGARAMLENGAWALVRASSNTPNLVVVCESPDSEDEMRAIFADLDAILAEQPEIGDYDQKI
ncbi:phosphomannomutase/phosphoglucomutase [Oceanicella actignis]|uniref:Phosphomannomutase / phosphoglucomutase n=1 Tax=Oceanicella actignis TaxID=1189325 RepID=A0A1M7TYB5_9RHOB|nr:phosphomannomutase/phosphoglucomutase [Oceanicella actignis]SET81515.1 phosphomannomutase / phosphoglucomutase [Oceanicella actignis]SHN75675.1 phosphomannomutase / phosphoglucomutase [Oceanicella actignis]